MPRDDESREGVHIGRGPRIRIGDVAIGGPWVVAVVAILAIAAVAIVVPLVLASRLGGGAPANPIATAISTSTPVPAAPTATPAPAPTAALAPRPTATAVPAAVASAPKPSPSPPAALPTTPAPAPAAVKAPAGLVGAVYPWPAPAPPDQVLLEGDAPTVMGVPGRLEDGVPVGEFRTSSATFGATHWSDVAIRVRFKALGGSEWGVLFRHSGADRYAVSVSPATKKVVLFRHSGRELGRKLGEASAPSLAYGRWHDLEVRVVGGTVAAFLDGSLVVYAVDPNPLPPLLIAITNENNEPPERNILLVSHIQVVEISSIETGGTPLATLTGKLLFAGEPVIRVTKTPPVFELKPRQPGQPCPQAQTRVQVVQPNYNPARGEYALVNVPPGDYCLWAWIDAAEPFDGQKGRGGDLHAEFAGEGNEVSLARGATTLDIPFHWVIHLVRPVDNRGDVRMGPECCDVLRSPVQVAWDPVPDSVHYDVNVYRCPAGDCAGGGQVARRSVQRHSLEVVLPPSAPGEDYFLYIEALDDRGRRLASLATGTSFRGWSSGYPFRIEPTALPTPTPTLLPTPTPTATPVQLTLFKPEINGLAVIVSGAVGPLEVVARLRWDWGDGNSYDGGFPQSHVYAQSGTYTVKVTAYDKAGRVLASRSVAVILPSQQ